MSTVRFGVLSTGRIAQQFAEDMAHVDGAEIVAASSRTLANAQAFAERWGVEHVCESREALLADDGVDAVYIATPHRLHVHDAADALRAGKAVLCEKPLVTGVGECQRLIRIAAETGGYLMEAMWTWFLPAVHQALAWVEDGRIGELVQINVDFGYPQRPYAPDKRVYDAAVGGGAMLEMGIYPVALCRLFLKRQPQAIDVRARHAPNGVEDHLTALLDYGDVQASIGTSFRAKLVNHAFIVGTDGYVDIPDFWRARRCDLYQGETCVARFDDDRGSAHGLSFETQAVVNDLRAGRRESSVVPLGESLALQETMEAIRRIAGGPAAPRD